MTTQITSFLNSHFQTSGEWCYSSQGIDGVAEGGSMGISDAGYQRCTHDAQCVNKVDKCVGSCTLF